VTIAQQVRKLWFNASTDNFTASYAQARALQQQAPKDLQVQGYMEGLTMLGKALGFL